ncbi:MAG: MopE-related protein [Myxococcota bacterium]|nr:MopE-related protein [Myxococcota bacterium]
MNTPRSMCWSLLPVLALLAACGDKDGDEDTADPGVYLMTDRDGDGYPIGVDCNDDAVRINPGAAERCDGIDNDCDGEIDEDGIDAPFWYADHDGDGFGVTVYTEHACEMPEGFSAIDGDCNDFDAAVHPDAVEVCDDIDNDCDTVVDGAFAEGKTDFYRDADADGYGDADSILAGCDAPPGYVDNADDCDDGAATDYPGADELCDEVDNDCDGRLDETCATEVSEAFASFTGEDILDYAGYDLSAEGDLNGDGIADLVVGAPQHDTAITNVGRVYIVHGPVTAGEQDLADADGVITGAQRSSYLGYELRSGHDFDADGYDDLLVSAYYADVTTADDSNEGLAFLFSGPLSGSVDIADATTVFTGENDTDLLGQYFIDGLGDLDGSGSIDVAVGAHYHDPVDPDDGETEYQQGGAVYVFYDPGPGTLSGADADATVIGTSTAEYIGYNGDAADLDGDGLLDLIVGASGEAEVYVYTGAMSGTYTVDDADILFDGRSGSAVGSNLAAGDFDGDGNMDLAVGSKYDDGAAQDAGRVYALTGPFPAGSEVDVEGEAVFETYETQSSRFFGTQISAFTAGDVDGDGFDDLLVGSYQNAESAYQSGAALLYFGPLSGSRSVKDADRPLVGSGSSQSVGIGASIGDLDGDGIQDVAVGARGYAYSRGAVFIFPGAAL